MNADRARSASAAASASSSIDSPAPAPITSSRGSSGRSVLASRVSRRGMPLSTSKATPPFAYTNRRHSESTASIRLSDVAVGARESSSMRLCRRRCVLMCPCIASTGASASTAPCMHASAIGASAGLPPAVLLLAARHSVGRAGTTMAAALSVSCPAGRIPGRSAASRDISTWLPSESTRPDTPSPAPNPSVSAWSTRRSESACRHSRARTSSPSDQGSERRFGAAHH
mmetsp:Transcript_25240/g.82898  ORF Transcript_25240/g.82898 Transcript_25240/m.82898 type:complete len:228 (-) Transcript_25240:536-1219(-)